MYYFKNIKTILFALIVVLSGCNSEDNINTDSPSEDALLTISFRDKATASNSKTTVNQELTKESLSFFLFQKKENGTDEFVFSPQQDRTSISKDLSSEHTYKIKCKIPDKDYGTIYLMALKDYKGPKPIARQSSESFSKTNLINLYSGILNTQNHTLYGTSEFKTNRRFISTSLKLINPLAKINLSVDETLYDATNHNYKIKNIASVRVYRSYDRSAIYIDPANLNSSGDVLRPTIPSDVKYNMNNGQSTSSIEEADKSPLLYDLSSSPATTYNDAIFIPEVKHTPKQLRKDVTSVVVGVYLENPEYAGQQRYYRADFAKYDDGDPTPQEFYSILRNHSYSFIFAGAKTPGTEEPEEALNAKSSLWLNLEVWNDQELSSVINGEYYFSMKSSDIKLPFTEGSSITIPYKTNINGDLNSSMKLTWDNGTSNENEYFEAYLNTQTKSIVITTKAENTDQQRTATLHINLMNHAFRVKVYQAERRPNFYISPTNYTVSGVYVRNQALIEGTHTLRVRLYAKTKNEKLNGLTYALSASEIEGVYIEETIGTFDNVMVDAQNGLDYQDVVLNIKGLSTRAKNKRLTVLATGQEESYLNAIIPFAYTPKKILGLYGSSSKNKLSDSSSFIKLITNTVNYGTATNSTVKAEQITYRESSDNNLAALIQSEKPDVIIWGDGYSLNRDQTIALKNFMTQRNELGAPGIVLAFNANPTHVISLFTILGVTSGTPKAISLNTKFNTITPNRGDYLHNRYRLPVYDWDLGVNGSFGALGTKYIKLDPDNSTSLTNLSFGEVLKYTGNVPFGKKTDKFDYATSACRLASLPLFWVGANKFLSEEQWLFDSDNRLANEGEVKYTASKELYSMRLTTNSVFFANLLEWAFYTSEYGLK
ncbi:hypothetical protein [Bacteroides propionicifaciens]|uniref:hypothetical protein n=1 Tax=Bacteroides propionicifaciens TaxID=392838 RepID=UPI00037E9B66|nr:hypothetical protein [Bacteroides propionicifaciens]